MPNKPCKLCKEKKHKKPKKLKDLLGRELTKVEVDNKVPSHIQWAISHPYQGGNCSGK